MSFSSQTKNEIVRKMFEKKCCQLAEASALIRMSGTIQLVGLNRVNIKVTTENAAIARLTFSLFKKVFNVHTEVLVKKNKVLKKSNIYVVLVTGANEMLQKMGIINFEDNKFSINYKIPSKLIERECCKRAYLRGAFLGGGSVSDPEKTYHLEFVTHSEEFSEELKNLINSYGLNSKVIMRKNNYVVYLKEGDQIVDLLNIIGAHNALLNLENIRIMKQMRNNVNRIVNCETANLSKIVEAALRQIKNIEYIKNTVGLKVLPDNLREIAELRLKYRDASLKELGQMLNPPVGKSGVNHRLRKIEKIAEKLKGGIDDD
ncbi:DNA-binding protein WhiA [Caminicella sporogenes]|uniref:DNA-binding protein WhiA n=1 Tax=Caminicella sporogenes TaxID=166485 RepID=UPI002541635E|nr:DNA-binding protein WhiA [Caminicella sporogenes]WIF95238.1 DNA-binding protein WhiA [Caminicella sporogenes]